MTESKTETKEASKRVPKLTDTFTKFQVAEFARRVHVAQPEFGVTLEQVLDSAYWGNVAGKLRAGDLIELHPEGLTYFAELIVIDAAQARARVKLLRFVDLVNEAPVPKQQEIVGEVDLGKYKAERNGRWFRVVRVSDKEVMKGGFSTLKDAETWADMNLKTA